MSFSIDLLHEADLKAVDEVAKAAYAAYYADDPQRVFVTSDIQGAITGYLIAQTRTIGPWVARCQGFG